MPSESNLRGSAVVVRCLSWNATKAKMMRRNRKEPPMMDVVFVRWEYIAFSIASNLRNRKMGRWVWY